MRLRTIGILFIVALLAFSALACGKSEKVQPTPEEAVEVATVAPTSASAPAKPKPTAVEAAEPDETEVEAPDFDDVDTSLSNSLGQLASYRIIQTITQQFADDDAPTELVMEVWFVREPYAHRMSITGTDDDGEATVYETMVVDGISYIRFGDQWMSSEDDEDEISGEDWYFDPSAYALGDPKSLGTAEVNGYPNARGFKLSGDDVYSHDDIYILDKAEIEYWVASIDGVNVTVRAIAEWTGTFWDESVGTIRIESNLLDVNKPIVIEAPEGVGVDSIANDIPIMDGAKSVSTMGGVIEYNVDASVDEVSDWYAAAMEDNGWTAGEDVGWEGMLMFTKGDRNTTVMIIEDGEGSSVIIAVE